MRWLVVLAVLVLAGCTAHTPPDAALTARLRPVVEASCAAMGLAEAERPRGRALDDQVGLLAMRLVSSNLVAKIDGGTYDRAVVVEGYRAALARREERRSRAQPPRLLVHLVGQAQWTTDQTLLAAALLAQYEQEARLASPPVGLQR